MQMVNNGQKVKLVHGNDYDKFHYRVLYVMIEYFYIKHIFLIQSINFNSSLSDIFNALDIANSVSNMRRFNYIAKVRRRKPNYHILLYQIGCTNFIQRKIK